MYYIYLRRFFASISFLFALCGSSLFFSAAVYASTSPGGSGKTSPSPTSNPCITNVCSTPTPSLPIATPTPRPTSTPHPTNTPQPTSTPRPTDTPKPIVVPTPSLPVIGENGGRGSGGSSGGSGSGKGSGDGSTTPTPIPTPVATPIPTLIPKAPPLPTNSSNGVTALSAFDQPSLVSNSLPNISTSSGPLVRGGILATTQNAGAVLDLQGLPPLASLASIANLKFGTALTLWPLLLLVSLVSIVGSFRVIRKYWTMAALEE